MADNKVDSILLEIDATTEKADGGIDKVIKNLTSLKSATEGLDTEKLKSIRDVFNSFSTSGNGIRNTAKSIRELTSAAKSLSRIKIDKLKAVSDSIEKIGNNFGKLNENNSFNIDINSDAINNNPTGDLQNSLGSIVNAKDVKSTTEKIQKLIEVMNKYKATIRGMESGKISFDSADYEAAVRGLQRVKEEFESYKESLKEIPSTVENVSKSLSTIGDGAGKLGFEKVSSVLKGIGDALPNVANGAFASSKAFQALSVGLSAISKAMPIIYAVVTVVKILVKAVTFAKNKVQEAISTTLKVLKTLVTKVRQGIAKMISSMKQYTKKIKEMFGIQDRSFSETMKKLKSAMRLFTFMLLRSAFTKLFESMTASLELLARYSDKIGTEFNKNVSLIASDLKWLSNSFITAFEPILNYVTPVLDFLIGKLVAASNAIAQFFSALTGKSTWTKAKKNVTNYAKSLEDAAGSAKKAANDLTVQMDELHILSEKDSGSGGGSDLDNPYDYFETEDVDSKFTSIADMIKEAWENADFTKIGAMIGEKLKNALDNIPWDGIKKKLKKIAKSTATFLNGFMETPGLFNSIGKTIAEGINSALEYVHSFVVNFHFGSLGTAIANMIIGACDGIDWMLIRATMLDLGYGITDMFNSIFQAEEMWTKLGNGIANTLNSAILFAQTAVSNFDFGSFGSAIGTLLGNSIGNIEGIGETFAGVINGAFETVLNFSSTYPWERLAQNFANGINDSVNGLDMDTIKESFDTFCEGVGTNLNTSITEIDWMAISTTFGKSVNTLFSGVGKFLKKIDFKKIGTDIANAINNAVDTIDWKEAGGTINTLVDGICTLVNTVIDEVDWNEILNGVGDAIAKVDWGQIFTTVFRSFAKIWSFKTMFKFVSFSSICESLYTNFVEEIAGVFGIGEDDGEISGIGENIVEGMIKGIKRALLPGQLTNSLQDFKNIINIVKLFFGIHSPSTVFETLGGYIVDGFVNGITSKFSECQNKILEWSDKVKQWFSGTSDGKITKTTWETYGQNIISGFKEKIGSAYSTTRDNIMSWATNTKDWFSNSSSGGICRSTWETYGDNIISGFREKVGSTYTTTKDNIMAWATKSKEWFNGGSFGSVNANTWSTYASNVISGFRTQIGSAYTTVKTNIVTWATKTKEWFSSTCSYSSFYEFARNVIDGFKNGIGNLYSTCKSTITSWGSSILDWFAEKLGIHSPSRVFNEFANFTIQGFNKGIASAGGSTKGIVDNWAKSFTDIELGFKVGVDTSNLSQYRNNYGADFTHDAIVERVQREISTNGTIQAVLNSGGGLKQALSEVVESEILPLMTELVTNTKIQAEKKESTNVYIGNKRITDAVEEQKKANGFRFATT